MNRQSITRILSLRIVLVTSLLIFGLPLWADDFTQVSIGELDEAREIFFSGGSIARSRELLDSAQRRAESLVNRRERLYASAQVHLFRGYIAMNVGNKALARSSMEEAGELATTLGQEGEFSEVYRILGDIHLYMGNLRGLGYRIRNGKEMRDFPQLAVELDGGNYNAALSRAVFLISAPEFAGGDARQAVQSLTGLPHSELDDVLRFRVYTWIGRGYNAQNNAEQARSWYNRALQIFPGSEWIGNLISELD